VVVRAREPEGRKRFPGQGRPPAKAAPPPALHLDAANLVQLNRLAGNSAVSSLVEPVVQRIELSKTDRSQIGVLKKNESRLAATTTNF
jgi:hypothetical protein